MMRRVSSMRLYLAGTEFVGSHPTLGGLGGLDHLAILTSYWYIENGQGWKLVKWAGRNQVPLFLDSGAYSAMTLGIEIDLERYIAFCLEHVTHFELIASLDAIGDWQTSLTNHERMRRAGVKSIPTFHVQEPFSALEDMLKENDYVALGVAGMQRRHNALLRWLTHCFRLRAQINPSCRLHGFGLTSANVMALFPWYSIDSTTWMVGRKFGEIIIRDGQQFRRVNRQKLSMYSQHYAIPSDVMPTRTSKNEDYFPIDRWNAREMLNWSHSLTLGKNRALAAK